MNERIQELELEAIAYADSKVPANDRYNDIYQSIVRGKFAELIVKECITIIRKRKDIAIDDDMNVDEAMSMAAFDIEDTFGVSK